MITLYSYNDYVEEVRLRKKENVRSYFLYLSTKGRDILNPVPLSQ
jgi:hypothetical protein